MTLLNKSLLDMLRGSRESGKLVWYLTQYREIRAVPPGRQRNYDNCMCPLTAIHWMTTSGKHLRPQEWGEAAFQLHIDPEWALHVAMAADFAPFHNPILRSHLREATGLSDVPPEGL